MKARKFKLAGDDAVRVSDAVTRRRELGDRLEVITYTYEPGAVFGRHQHEAEQLTVVLEGVLVFSFDDGDVTLREGEALLIPGDLPHGAQVPDDAGRTRTLNVFSPVRDQPPEA